MHIFKGHNRHNLLNTCYHCKTTSMVLQTSSSSATAYPALFLAPCGSEMPAYVAPNELMSSSDNEYSKEQQTIGKEKTKPKQKKKVSWAPVLTRIHARSDSLNMCQLGPITRDEPEGSMSFSAILASPDLAPDESTTITLGDSLTQRVANLTAQLSDGEDSDALLEGMPEVSQFFKPDFSRAASDKGYDRRSLQATSLGKKKLSLILFDSFVQGIDADEQEEKALHLLFLGDNALTDERWSEALAWYKQAVRHQRDIYDPVDNRIHQTVINIAECHANLGNPTLALSNLQDCLRVQLSTFDEGHEDVVLTKKYIADLMASAFGSDTDACDVSGTRMDWN